MTRWLTYRFDVLTVKVFFWILGYWRKRTGRSAFIAFPMPSDGPHPADLKARFH